jgi:Trypsin-like peptidase domain/Effector-associated domain 1
LAGAAGGRILARMAKIELGPQDWKRIKGTLKTAYATVDDLSMFVEESFGEIHGAIAWGKGFDSVVHEVVLKSNAKGRLGALLRAAAAEFPSRPDLLALALRYDPDPGGAASAQADRLAVLGALEKATVPGDPFLDTTRLATWLLRVERQVCLIRCGSSAGTGFLVAPDLVLTCYHVVESHLKGAVPVAGVQVRFDYRRSATGEAPSYDEGWMLLDPGWTIPHAPYSPADLTLHGDPAPADLDFALLKLAQPAGSMVPPGEDRARGWIDLSTSPPLPAPSSFAAIVQHPQTLPAGSHPPQQPLKIAAATPGYDGAEAGGARLVYRVSTLHGSSGSPVFDQRLRAFGLHHNRGQMAGEAVDLARNNRGVPLGRIREALAEECRAKLVPAPGG